MKNDNFLITEELAQKIINIPVTPLPKTDRELRMIEEANRILTNWKKSKEGN
ncbi:hypothetical protein CPT_Mater26 [Bacillus phage Mater]|uniref:Uncharacterized protein n=1 Tax=Bacillus phage Mater TaxID=1540090 RepID=A0A0A0RUF2_9CAUD|nr:hypothetical protein CPT_Mater26 [Bacillus phage Mater]AIW03183.1 hypothetical protein CPT_Mater26 [Bacillus phage Mater]